MSKKKYKNCHYCIHCVEDGEIGILRVFYCDIDKHDISIAEFLLREQCKHWQKKRINHDTK